MLSRAVALACLLAGVVALAGCGTETLAQRASTPAAATDPAAPGLPEGVAWDGEGFAPPVTMDLAGTLVPLRAWSACYGNACTDGFAEPPYPKVGDRETVAFSFPDPGWSFEATFRNGPPDECPRAVTVDVPATSDRTFALTHVGPPGSWSVDLFGTAPEGGDVITTFSWTTTTTPGVFPEAATGTAGVLADHDGELTSYGVEVYVEDLATSVGRAEAALTVINATGRSVTLPATRSKHCTGPGALAFTAPDDTGLRATELGPGPFTYDVALTLDGTTYHGVGTWPDDEAEDIAPHVPLTWSPALPVYRG